MKTLVKGMFVFGLLLAVSPLMGAEIAHNGVTGAVTSGAPSGLQHLLEGGKNQIVAALLAFFLGGLGIHLYYLGYKKKGTHRLLTTLGGSLLVLIGEVLVVAAVAAGTAGTFGYILFFGGLVLLAISSIMSLIEFIRILTGSLKPADGSDYSR